MSIDQGGLSLDGIHRWRNVAWTDQREKEKTIRIVEVVLCLALRDRCVATDIEPVKPTVSSGICYKVNSLFVVETSMGE